MQQVRAMEGVERSHPRSPLRRFELVDPNGASKSSRGRSRIVVGNRGRKVAITSVDSSVTDASTEEIDVTRERSHSSSRDGGIPAVSPASSASRSTPDKLGLTGLDTTPLSRERGVSAASGGPAARYASFVAGSDRSVVSDLSDSVRPRPIAHGPPRGSPARQRDKGVTSEGESKRTERTETVFETILESCIAFCGSLDEIPTGSPATGDPYRPTKEERKSEAEETFLGKIITCNPALAYDYDDFHGCTGPVGCTGTWM
ncbi:hypothetical protein ACHAXT_005214 [Thalassiosira profunda]